MCWRTPWSCLKDGSKNSLGVILLTDFANFPLLVAYVRDNTPAGHPAARTLPITAHLQLIVVRAIGKSTVISRDFQTRRGQLESGFVVPLNGIWAVGPNTAEKSRALHTTRRCSELIETMRSTNTASNPSHLTREFLIHQGKSRTLRMNVEHELFSPIPLSRGLTLPSLQ